MSHVRIGLYALISGTAEEVVNRARAPQGMLEVFRAQPGFRAYGIAQTAEGKLLSVSWWDEASQADKANDLAASWTRENIADLIRLENVQLADFLLYESA